MSTESQHEIAAALLRLGSATLGESGGLATDRRLKPAWVGATLAAPAYPVGCTPGDNLAVHVGVTTAPAGSVLVVDVGQVPDRGYWGEVLTTAAEAANNAAARCGLLTSFIFADFLRWVVQPASSRLLWENVRGTGPVSSIRTLEPSGNAARRPTM